MSSQETSIDISIDLDAKPGSSPERRRARGSILSNTSGVIKFNKVSQRYCGEFPEGVRLAQYRHGFVDAGRDTLEAVELREGGRQVLGGRLDR